MVPTSVTPISLPFRIPLCYDMVYYMESPDNEPLNQAMRQLAAAGQPLFENTEMQPFPFKLMCLSQEELAADRLTADLADKFEPELVADTIADLRECLQADKGGTLTARCLPKFDGKVRVDDRAVCIIEDFGTTRPENAEETAKSFAHSVAMENFHRLAGISYSRFLKAKEEAQHPHPSRQSSDNTMGFLIVHADPNEVLQKMQERLDAISNMINEKTNYNDVLKMLDAEVKELKDKYKMNTFCKLFVKDKDLYLKVSDTENRVIEFGRDTSKALYVFYLQQIQRAKKNPGVPQYLSQDELEDYKNELFEIYQWFSGSTRRRIEDICDMWDASKGFMFRDAISCIKQYFENEFDVATIQKNYNKSYFCSIKRENSKKSGRLYGADLDVDDFNLDQFNYRRIKPIRL